MSIRQSFRDDFPRGWWRNPRWWSADLKKFAGMAITTVAPVLLAHKALYAVRHCQDPVKLSRINGEAWTYGFLAGVWGLLMAIVTTVGQAGMLPFLLGMGSFLLLNVAVAGAVVSVLAASRIRSRVEWKGLDYVKAHSAPDDRPPYTVEEYEAARLKSLLGQ